MDEGADRILRQIETLLNDEQLKLEFKVYKRAYYRLRVRLRNNLLIAQFKHLATKTKQLETNFPASLFRTYLRQLTNSKAKCDKKRDHALNALKNSVQRFISQLDQLLDKSLHVYCKTQSHLKVGHLIHHLIIVRTTISRLRIYFKALLVYASDLYLEIDEESHNTLAINETLAKHGCKARVARSKIQVVKDDNKSICGVGGGDCEIIGQLIDRKTLNRHN